jgi:hypothetical protein
MRKTSTVSIEFHDNKLIHFKAVNFDIHLAFDEIKATTLSFKINIFNLNAHHLSHYVCKRVKKKLSESA